VVISKAPACCQYCLLICIANFARLVSPGQTCFTHLTPKRLEWPQRYFERHGAKAAFLARLIAIFPPIAANLLAGMTSMSWRKFLV
jgi:membrane protein DedA with SNARE-associated domain